MSIKETLKHAIGYNNIVRLKKIKGVKSYIAASAKRQVKKINFDSDIVRIKTEIKIPDKHVFFGYYDIKQIDATGKFALIHIVDKRANPARDAADLAVVNLNNNEIEVFARSRAWSWQQGARLRWDPTDAEQILYNDYEYESYVTKIFNLKEKKIVGIIPVPLYDITPDGKYGLSLNFDRLQRLRPGYGYSCIEDKTKGVAAPDDDGIFLWSKEEKCVRQIVSLKALAEGVTSEGAEHYINHISVSPSGKKFMFFHLWSQGKGTKWKMRLFIADIDGTGLRCIDDKEIISHYCWYGDDVLLTTALPNEVDHQAKYLVYELDTGRKKVIRDENLQKDGHPTFFADGISFLGDTYPQKNCMQYVFTDTILGGNYKNVVEVYANPFLVEEHRCDLHPRLVERFGYISIDTTYTGRRSVIVFQQCSKGSSGMREDKNIKISMIAHGLSDGGAERVESILANYLVSKGYEVQFIASLSPERVYELDSKVDYTYKKSPFNNMLLKLIAKNVNVYRQLKPYKPDIIVSFLTNEAFLSGLLIKKPLVCTLRNDPYNYNNSLVKEKIRQYLFTKANRIIFQTVGAMHYFDEAIQKKGIIIGNPIKENLPYWNKEHHEKTILTACRLEKQKNIPLMLNAFARFHTNHPDYRLQICGVGQLENELKSLAAELGVGSYVDFLGFRNDVHTLMANAAVFTLSSDYEGVSNSMLEALAIGVPVVCTDSSPGGAATYIVNGENGILTPVGNVDELCSAYCKVADDSAYSNELSKKAILIRKRLEQKQILFEWENNIIQSLNEEKA